MFNKNNYAIFTVCNLNYLSKALVLGDSIVKYSGVKLKIYLFDKKQVLNADYKNVEIVWMEDLNVPNYSHLAFKYDIIEFSTSLKPYITLLLLEDFEKVVFFDADICLYSEINPIINDLETNSILLTPHYTTPQTSSMKESDLGMMRFGSFNLGFYAVKKSQSSISFLSWWSRRCIDLCNMESQFGLSTDQKWVSIAPCLFEDIKISFNLGYNCAPWNSFERIITKNDFIYYVNNKFKLVFFHFSNFDFDDVQYLNKRSEYEIDKPRPDLLELGQQYKSLLIEKLKIAPNCSYSYDFFDSGEYISPTLRNAYISIYQDLEIDHNPFEVNGPILSFARKNNLLERGNEPYKRNGFSEISNNKGKLKIIYIIMRFLLRIVGPNKFQNLSRLLVYLSSYRQNRELWKF